MPFQTTLAVAATAFVWLFVVVLWNRRTLERETLFPWPLSKRITIGALVGTVGFMSTVLWSILLSGTD